jgi:predicted CXXCH cytochrome family protein
MKRKPLFVLAIAFFLAGLSALLWTPLTADDGTDVNNDGAWYQSSSWSLFADIVQEGDSGTGHPPQDLACRQCHSDSEKELTFPSGESLPVQVDIATLENSAHGDLMGPGLACTDCHQAADYQFPHEAQEIPDLRAFETALSSACERCHVQAHFTSHPDQESESPVICTDCHGAHEVMTVEQLRNGEGSQRCVDCHLEFEVQFTDPVQITQMIREGLFQATIDSNYCLSCHSQPGLTFTFENGDVISATIDEEDFHNSVHGADNPWQPLECTTCHDRYAYPHEPVEVSSEREYTLQQYTFCIECHDQHYERTLDSVHGAALEEGNLEAAVCTDCHGAHDTTPPGEPREEISHTCEQCHSTIFDEYAESVHGDSLLSESNPDVPTCIECHGVHDINDPTTALARARSPELCAGCHADEDLMARYDISTDVFETYVADFHGETVTLFEHQDPNLETNKAVCYDCHGVHNIKRPDDPEAGIKTNLLVVCQQCHPDATANFSDAWTSHFKPSLENNPLVFMVNSFYAIFIPLTLGFFIFLIGTDVFRQIRIRLRKKD